MIDYHTCRFCGDSSFLASQTMLQFGRRHWAHKLCYLERRGLAGLTINQIESLPYYRLKELGLIEQARAILDAGQPS